MRERKSSPHVRVLSAKGQNAFTGGYHYCTSNTRSCLSVISQHVEVHGIFNGNGKTNVLAATKLSEVCSENAPCRPEFGETPSIGRVRGLIAEIRTILARYGQSIEATIACIERDQPLQGQTYGGQPNRDRVTVFQASNGQAVIIGDKGLFVLKSFAAVKTVVDQKITVDQREVVRLDRDAPIELIHPIDIPFLPKRTLIITDNCPDISSPKKIQEIRQMGSFGQFMGVSVKLGIEVGAMVIVHNGVRPPPLPPSIPEFRMQP